MRLKQRISLNDQVRNPVELARMGLQWMFAGSGPLTVGAGQVGGAACTEYAVGGRPDVQFNVMPLSVDKPGDPLHSYSGFTASVWQCHAKSRGQLAIRSTDPFEQPRIEPNYFAEEIDRKTIVAGLQDSARASIGRIRSAISGMSRWCRAKRPTAMPACGISRAPPAARCFIASAPAGWGTMRRSVLDPQLRVRGVERLRVIDASVMPQITSANTNASSLMIGERGAALIMS